MIRDPWLRLAPSAQPPKARLFFMPYAGAGIGQFLGWRRYAPPWVQVGGLQLPGREERVGETFCLDLATVCRHGVESLAPVLDLPYAIFAHSLGATLAIEMVSRLFSEGLPLPKRVILSGANPPHRMERHDLDAVSDRDLLAQAQIWSGSMLGQLPAEIQAHFLQVLRADIRMLDLYECRLSKLPPVEIEAHGGTSDPLVSVESLQDWRRWRPTLPVQFHKGGHFFFRSRETALCERLTRDLLSH